MADFCKQCAEEHGFENDFAYTRIIEGQEVKLAEGDGWAELCEGCGPCIVTDDGVCIDPHCMKHHGMLPKEANNE